MHRPFVVAFSELLTPKPVPAHYVYLVTKEQFGERQSIDTDNSAYSSEPHIGG